MVSTESVAAALAAGKYPQAQEEACIRFGVGTPLGKAKFLAQVPHELDGFHTANRCLWQGRQGPRQYPER